MMEAEQAPSSLAAEPEAPVFGEEMVEATAEEPYGEVPEETSAVEGVVVEGVAAEEPQAEVLGETGRSRTTEGEAMLAVGHAAYARKQWPAAMKAFQQSAEAGNAEGAWELSLMHAHGKTGVVDKDQAREWLKIAADGGAVKAQMFLAQMSAFGRGGYEKDESVAFEYLTRAADQGNAHATHQVGVRYLHAVGVEQDLDKAIEHLEKAIERGSKDAVKDLKIAQKKKKKEVTAGLAEEQRAAIAAFKRIDANGDGELTAEEIYRALSKKNADVTLERVQEIMAKADKDQNGTISQEEYLDAVAAMGPGWIGSWLGKIAARVTAAFSGEAMPEAAETVKCLTNEELRVWVNRWCSGDRSLPPISTWNTSKVTDMSELFMRQKGFNDDISAWDTSSVTTMRLMCSGASSFNQPLNDWRVDNVTDMCQMFRDAKSFNHRLNDWRVHKVTNMSWMFSGASSFNQPLSDWRVDNVTNMQGMFYGASSFDHPLNDWRVDNVTNMSNMFLWAKSFNHPIGAWRVDKVTSMRAMFNGAFAFNQPLNDWRVDKVTDMCGIFMAAKAFNQPLGNWRVDNATNVDNMFEDSAFSHWEDLGDPKLRSQKPSCCAVS
ncbi:unnamed protein product [Pelagomonas calceolata]|uniref:EF-hand domain-containing protein n=2 Tax=Pelagomonas calceolata TaxID=35677 RepID=A0A8J2SYZ5_9STRA|nr:unnamed protein product [Pelagomonas calceolata]